MKKLYRQVVDTTKQFRCSKCGFVETDTVENRAFHSSPDHEVRISEDYIGNGEYSSVVVASTKR